jgi:hypothetical protein
MKITNLEQPSIIKVTVKNNISGNFLVYEFDSVDDLKCNAEMNQEKPETIYFVNVNGTSVYSYLMFRCLANYTEGLNWGKLASLM